MDTGSVEKDTALAEQELSRTSGSLHLVRRALVDGFTHILIESG